MAAKWWERACCACTLTVQACPVVPNSLRPYRLRPARLLCPRDFRGKNNGVCCHALLQGIFPTQGFKPGSLPATYTSATWEAWRKRWVLLIHRLTETIFFLLFTQYFLFFYFLFSKGKYEHSPPLLQVIQPSLPHLGKLQGPRIRIGLALGEPPSWWLLHSILDPKARDDFRILCA